MIYLLDTSFIINFFKRAGRWADILGELVKGKDGQLAASVITYAELCYGITRSVFPQKERERVEGFLQDFLVEIIPVTAETAREYAGLKRNIEETGVPLDDFDLLIGATAKIKDAILVTDNKKHFERVEGLKIFKFHD